MFPKCPKDKLEAAQSGFVPQVSIKLSEVFYVRNQLAVFPERRVVQKPTKLTVTKLVLSPKLSFLNAVHLVAELGVPFSHFWLSSLQAVVSEW